MDKETEESIEEEEEEEKGQEKKEEKHSLITFFRNIFVTQFIY